MNIEAFHQLLDDPKTNHYILFEQFMDYICEMDYKKYKKTLKKIGEYVDEARKGHGMCQRVVWE